jgi:hypothetical protein
MARLKSQIPRSAVCLVPSVTVIDVTEGEPAAEFWREFYAEIHAERSRKAMDAA